MADIFVSYEKRDREFVRRLVMALQSSGWSVFWDRNIATGESWRTILERALHEMSCMVVVWSRHSVHSDWVIDEVEEGKSRGILLPIVIDDTSPPRGFRQLQTLAFSGWDGDCEATCFRQLLQDLRTVASRVGDASSGSVVRSRPPTSEAFERASTIPQPASISVHHVDKNETSSTEKQPSKLRMPALVACAVSVVLLAAFALNTYTQLDKPSVTSHPTVTTTGETARLSGRREQSTPSSSLFMGDKSPTLEDRQFDATTAEIARRQVEIEERLKQLREKENAKLGETPQVGTLPASSLYSGSSESRNSEFEAIKADMQKLSRMQEDTSKQINEMNRLADEAIKHTKGDR